MELYAGIDIGTQYTKCVMLDREKNVVAQSVLATRDDLQSGAENILRDAAGKIGGRVEDVREVGVTGYEGSGIGDLCASGMSLIPEIMAIGRGIAFRYRGEEAKLILDIGNEKWRFIYTDKKGKVLDFVTNEKCGAGSGMFLDYIVEMLDVDIDEFTGAALRSRNGAVIDQGCGVYLESEIMDRLARGENPDDLFAGVLHTVFRNIFERSESINARATTLYFTGGVANNLFLQREFGKQYERLVVPQDPACIGALGAALFLYAR